MHEFTELNEADLGAVAGGTDAVPCELESGQFIEGLAQPRLDRVAAY